MARLEIGTKAPAFTLPNQGGHPISLKEFAGERFVLYFYPADDTPGCTKEACQFNDGLGAFRKLAVKVVGVSPDSAEKHVAFRAKYGLKFDLLSRGTACAPTDTPPKSSARLRASFVVATHRANPVPQ
jgi:thioredoxin-dependent peroxiredoxin